MPSLRAVAAQALDRMPRGVVRAVGHHPVLRTALRPLVNRVVPAETTAVTVRSGGGEGLRLEIEPREEKYYWTGAHEPHLQAALVQLLEPGGRFWDVGAHIGFFTLQAARLVGPSGAVVAIEPVGENRARLERNITLNDAVNVTVVAAAASDREGTATVYSRDGLSVMWTLDRELGDEPSGTVALVTLDALAERTDPPDVVKIDAEGVEVDVLRGALGLVAASRPTLLVEFMSAARLEAARALLPGYAFERLAANHYVVRPAPSSTPRPIPPPG